MNTTKFSDGQISMKTSTLFRLLTSTISLGSFQPNPEGDPPKPGPWDPVIRAALRGLPDSDAEPSSLQGRLGNSLSLEQILELLAAFNPRLWEILHPHVPLLSGGGRPVRAGDLVSLNPQPLPPRWKFFVNVADEIISRTESLARLVSGMGDTVGERGIIIVGGLVADFDGDWCPTGRPPISLPWPWPGPRPNWFTETVTPLDQLVIGAQFAAAAETSTLRVMAEVLTASAARIAQNAVTRLG